MRAAILVMLAASASADDDDTLEHHVPGAGTQVAHGGWGAINFGFYFSARYLYQGGLAETYTDATGVTSALDRRNDFQFQKVMLFFTGWLGDPALRYTMYTWSANPSQGLGAQVVVAGYVMYKIAHELELGTGIYSLPTTVTTRGNFPHWLRVDARTTADDYFRGSYTSGIWAMGTLAGELSYHVMLGNNLSQLGVDAGQLDMGPNTLSLAAWWTFGGEPTNAGYGDFDASDALAGSIGAAYTRSREDKESQPSTDAPENSQLRTSDGRLVFADGTFAPGVQIARATYHMANLNAAVRYRGFALYGEGFYRRLTRFAANGPLPIDSLDDGGYQAQLAVTFVPRTWMAYAFQSTVFGDDGDPWDLGIGGNYYPFRTRTFRCNAELFYVKRSPVGNLSSPIIVGGTGTVFVANIEARF